MENIDGFLTFRGDTNREAEDFIRAVNIQAFKLDKSDDQKWITTFASACFSGKALRWYRQLPFNTRQDWGLLQEAILDNDWEDGEPTPSASRLNPTPAASPTPAAAPPMPAGSSANVPRSVPHSISSSTKRGRIRVLIEGATKMGGLCVNSPGTRFIYCTKREEAILVEWDPSAFPCKLRMLGANSSFCLVGAQFRSNDHKENKLGSGNAPFIYLTPISESKSSVVKAMTASKSMKTPASGPIRSTFWDILQDGTLRAVIKQGGAKYQVDVMISDSGRMSLVTDREAACKKWPERQLRKVSPIPNQEASDIMSATNALANADQRTIEELENKLDLDRYTNAPENAHKTDDSKDSQNLRDRAAKAVTEELAADLADAKEKAKPPTAAAKDQGHKPSRGAEIDEQIQKEEEETLRNKGKI